MREQWRRAFSPISAREIGSWLQDWRAEIATIPYLHLTKAANGSILNLIELRAVLKIDGLHFDMVKADVERIWMNGVAKGLRGSHCFRNTENGIAFYFSALTESQNFITGVFYVSRKER
jgi:hypothetical protein